MKDRKNVIEMSVNLPKDTNTALKKRNLQCWNIVWCSDSLHIVQEILHWVSQLVFISPGKKSMQIQIHYKDKANKRWRFVLPIKSPKYKIRDKKCTSEMPSGSPRLTRGSSASSWTEKREITWKRSTQKKFSFHMKQIVKKSPEESSHCLTLRCHRREGAENESFIISNKV